jgi:signal transduction histidine kinase
VTAQGSLRRRLIAASMAWLVVALAASGTLIRFAFEDSVERAFQQRLVTALRSLAAALEVAPDGTARLSRPVGDPRFDQPLSGWYWQVTGGSGIALRSRSLWDAALPVLAAPEAGAVIHGHPAGPQGERLLTAERDLTFPEHAQPLHVMVAASRAELDAELARFDRLLLASFVTLAAGLAAAMAIQVRYGLRPFSKLAAELAELKRTEGRRLSSGYPAEIAPLAEALNAVLDHDAQLVERARAHVGNLAHGLKTPLAVLRAELSSGAPDPAVLAEQTERMGRLVEHNLARARAAASSAHVLGTKVAAAEIAADIARMLAKVHADKGLSIEVAGETVLPGDRDDLAEILGNLMDNACKWARGRVLVTLQPGLLTVEDDGPGVSEAQRAEATRRGTRLDETAPGHGLGLAIVHDLAALHGGRLELDRSQLGGLKASVVY